MKNKRVNTLLCIITLLCISHQVFAIAPFFSNPVGTIILDAGHGGKDPGAVGLYKNEQGEQMQLYEKDITLSLVLQIQEILTSLYPSIDIILTRDNDSYVSLADRAEIANSCPYKENMSKIFISIHANASTVLSANGYEIWHLRTSVKKQFYTPELNETGITNLGEQMNAALNNELDSSTELLANSIETALTSSLPDSICDRGVKKSLFYVLRYTQMPAVLVEAGFITNPEERERLMTPLYQEQLSLAVSSGIAAYIESVREKE